jgi:hypothetical protein
MYITIPALVLIGIFVMVFVTEWLAKLNSPIVDGIAWILGILLFVFILLSKIHF